MRRRKEWINFYQNHSIIGLDLLIVAHGNGKKRMRLQIIKTGKAINLIIEGDSDENGNLTMLSIQIFKVKSLSFVFIRFTFYKTSLCNERMFVLKME